MTFSGTRLNAEKTDLSAILPEEVEEEVKAAAEISMGTEVLLRNNFLENDYLLVIATRWNNSHSVMVKKRHESLTWLILVAYIGHMGLDYNMRVSQIVSCYKSNLQLCNQVVGFIFLPKTLFCTASCD